MHPQKHLERLYLIVIVAVMLLLIADAATADGNGENDQPAIAVAETVGDTLSESSLKTVQDIIMSELGRVEYLTVVERSRLEAVFEEQELQLSGVTDTEEAVEIGELLNATIVVVSAVNEARLGYDLSTRAVDVESGEIITTERTTIASELDLANGAEHTARMLTNRISRVLDVDQHVGRQSDSTNGIRANPYYNEITDILTVKRWEEGEFSQVRDFSYGISAHDREAIYDEFEKDNAGMVRAINVLPFALGSALIDRNSLPITFQGLGSLFALGGAAANDGVYVATGLITFGVGYVLGFTEPGRDQEQYNDRLERALNLD